MLNESWRRKLDQIKSTKFEDDYGNIVYIMDKDIEHLEILPNGKIRDYSWETEYAHREDGHAVEYSDGDKYWYLDGKRHREDGPAVEHIHGDKYWYLDGKRHRIYGPAIERSNGDKAWWLNGKRHRIDGPAIEGFDGFKAWCLNDIYMDFQEWKQEVRKYYDNQEDYLLMLLKLD